MICGLNSLLAKVLITKQGLFYPKKLFDNWQEFVMESNTKCEYSSVQFNKKLSLMCVDGIENKKGSKGIRAKVFDIKKLEAKYGIVRND